MIAAHLLAKSAPEEMPDARQGVTGAGPTDLKDEPDGPIDGLNGVLKGDPKGVPKDGLKGGLKGVLKGDPKDVPKDGLNGGLEGVLKGDPKGAPKDGLKDV